MDFNFSMIDGGLAVLLAIVVIWAALKLVTRLVVGIILVVVIAVMFFGVHLSDFGINLGG
ncbi:MAG: hypothetical protein NT015_13755 [Alphaproteobacteria bacterium]|nr:hypothetical protein [Alphaproteobacteria bacterium]